MVVEPVAVVVVVVNGVVATGVVMLLGGGADRCMLLTKRFLVGGDWWQSFELVVIEIGNSVKNERRRPGNDPIAQAVGFCGRIVGRTSLGLVGRLLIGGRQLAKR